MTPDDTLDPRTSIRLKDPALLKPAAYKKLLGEGEH